MADAVDGGVFTAANLEAAVFDSAESAFNHLRVSSHDEPTLRP